MNLDKISSETLKTQLRAPLVLAEVLPIGLFGAFAALMLAAFVSTHDTYLHSWGSILVQDVIMPFRKEPFDKDTHLKVFKIFNFGVAIFIFSFQFIISTKSKNCTFFCNYGCYICWGIRCCNYWRSLLEERDYSSGLDCNDYWCCHCNRWYSC